MHCKPKLNGIKTKAHTIIVHIHKHHAVRAVKQTLTFSFNWKEHKRIAVYSLYSNNIAHGMKSSKSNLFKIIQR